MKNLSFKVIWPYLRTLLFFYVGIKGIYNFINSANYAWLQGLIGAIFVIVATGDIISQIKRLQQKQD